MKSTAGFQAEFWVSLVRLRDDSIVFDGSNNNNNNNLFYNRFAFTCVRQISTLIALLGRTYYRDSFETKFGLSTVVVSLTL